MGIFHSFTYRFNNFIDISKDVIIRKADDAIAFFFFELACAFLIVFFLSPMRTAINFNDQIFFRAKEIDDVGTDSMLPAKI